MQKCILVVHPASLRKKCDFYSLYQRYIYIGIYIWEIHTHTHTLDISSPAGKK